MKRHSNANHYLLTWFIFIRYGWASVGWTKEKTTHRERDTQMLVWDHIDISLSTECGHVIIELHSTNFRLHQKTYWNGATNQSAARERSENKKQQQPTERVEAKAEKSCRTVSIFNIIEKQSHEHQIVNVIAITFSSDRSFNAVTVASFDCFWPKMNWSKSNSMKDVS